MLILYSSTIGVIQSVYDVFSGTISGLNPYDTISNIETSYTWNTAETAIFIYFKPENNPNANWILSGRYTQVASTITAVTPTITIGTNRTVNTGSNVKIYSGTTIPNNYNSTFIALDYYLYGYDAYNDARISYIPLKGIQDKTIKTVNLSMPDIPASIY